MTRSSESNPPAIGNGALSAAEFDQRLRERLADSLAHLLERGGPALGLTLADAAPALSALRAHAVEPAVFGRYYDSVLAYSREDLQSARRWCAELLELVQAPARPRLVALTPADLGDDAERFARLAFPDADPAPMVAPSAGAVARFAAHHAEARAWLTALWPERAAEVDALTHLTVAAASRPDAPPPGFAGATSFMLWGAVFFSVDVYDSPLKLLEGLVHEAAHARLFGLAAADGPLTLNPLSASYPSPLRKDPRPMDGIYHATYVCAELIALYTRLAESNDGRAAPDAVARRLADWRAAFWRGAETVRADGQLSPLGEAVFAAAEATVGGAAAA